MQGHVVKGENRYLEPRGLVVGQVPSVSGAEVVGEMIFSSCGPVTSPF